MTTADDKTDSVEMHADAPGFTPETLNAGAELAGAEEAESEWDMGDYTVSTHVGRDALWIVTRRKGKGGIALRSFPILGEFKLKRTGKSKDGGEWRVQVNSGTLTVTLQILGERLLRLTTRITPSHDLLVVFWPRDLYVLDNKDDPRGARGRVEAGQRGLNAGVCYLCMDKPAFGSVLYMQNFSELNDYFTSTNTKPDGVVGGEWPELGYQPPGAPNANSPPRDPLEKGREYTISDAVVCVRPDCARNEVEMARNFVEMLADIYPHLTRPEPRAHDWLWRAEKTLLDLKTSPDACEEHFGFKYLRPYTASEVPDSMVQMTVLTSLREYEKARGERDPLSDELAAGMEKFFDDELRTIRRYLPDVDETEKNKDAVDSWYLYHPLMNLARLAMQGEDWADTLFRKSIAFGVRMAQHFKYRWPIQYSLRDMSVITPDRGDGLGQTDVGGFYAYVMLLASELTDNETYVEEARAALKALEDYRFELVYQTNLTAWGYLACLKLWKRDNDERYLDQSFVFLAGLLHNCELWDSRIGQAAQYANFFGITCLHDGPYMSAYEAFEVFAAFDEALKLCGDTLPDSARLLISEYRRHALDVLWYFYPDALPPDGLAQKIRNGHIDRALSFPLEDVYGDGSPAGQVGQEIYGAGSAFVVAARSYFDCGDAPFRIYADYPVEVETIEGESSIRLSGPGGGTARVRLVSKQGARPAAAADQEPSDTGDNFVEYKVPADSTLKVRWQ